MFEWNEAKRLATLVERHLDFLDVPALFDGRPTVSVPTGQFHHEERFLTVTLWEGKHFTVVWTWRGQKRRIISFRRSRDEEERAYRAVHG